MKGGAGDAQAGEAVPGAEGVDQGPHDHETRPVTVAGHSALL